MIYLIPGRRSDNSKEKRVSSRAASRSSSQQTPIFRIVRERSLP